MPDLVERLSAALAAGVTSFLEYHLSRLGPDLLERAAPAEWFKRGVASTLPTVTVNRDLPPHD
jgi:hypothetical protein